MAITNAVFIWDGKAIDTIPSPGSNGQFLKSQGASSKPIMANITQSDVSGLTTDLTTLQNNINTNATNIGDLQSAISTAQADISTIESDMGGMQSEVTALQDAMGDLATVATTGSYNDLSNKPSIPSSQVNSDWSAVSGISQILNKPSLATVATSGSYTDLSNKPTIPSAQIQSDWAQTNSGSVDFIKNKPAAHSFSSATRSLVNVNTATGFQISSTRDSIANYNISINTSLSLSGGAAGQAVLEIAATNSTTPGDWTIIDSLQASNTGTLTIGLALNQIIAAGLNGTIPAGYYTRIRTINNTGTPTYSYNFGRETLL